MASASDVISLIREVHQLCEDASATKKTIKVVGKKMDLILPVIRRLRSEEDGGGELVCGDSTASAILAEIDSEVRRTRDAVEKAGRMNRAVYILTARGIHDDLEKSLGHIQFSLATLETHRGAAFREEMSRFRAEWQARREELDALREEEKLDKKWLMEGNAAGKVAEVVGTRSLADIEDAMKVLKAERDGLEEEPQVAEAEEPFSQALDTDADSALTGKCFRVLRRRKKLLLLTLVTVTVSVIVIAVISSAKTGADRTDTGTVDNASTGSPTSSDLPTAEPNAIPPTNEPTIAAAVSGTDIGVDVPENTSLTATSASSGVTTAQPSTMTGAPKVWSVGIELHGAENGAAFGSSVCLSGDVARSSPSARAARTLFVYTNEATTTRRCGIPWEVL